MPWKHSDSGDRHGHGRNSSHQAASDRSRDLHPLQHLRSHLPGGRDHARLTQLCGRCRQVQPVHGLHFPVSDRLDRQLARYAETARLQHRRAADLGHAARRTVARAAGRPGTRRRDADRRAGDSRHVAAGRHRRGNLQQRPLWRHRAAVVRRACLHQRLWRQVRTQDHHRHGDRQCACDRCRPRI
ncbi:hypothetical protein D9M70_474840 [compost metagenome]